MRFGLGLPTCREGRYPIGFAGPETFRAIATTAEELGFHALWANDHQAAPAAARSVPLDRLPSYYESLVTLGFVAGFTSRIRLMTTVIVASMRQPVLFAKQVAALDRLSGGRFVLGIGLGNDRAEFEAIVGHPEWHRGRMLDEFVDAIRLLLDEQRGAFEGKYFRFGELSVAPPPTQRPFPVYLSGNGPLALRRIGTRADGWIVAMLTPEQIGESVAVIRREAAAAGRDPSAIGINMFLWSSIGPERRADPLGFVGPAPDLVAVCREYEAAGVDHIGIIPAARGLDEYLEQARLVARDVMPAFGDYLSVEGA